MYCLLTITVFYFFIYLGKVVLNFNISHLLFDYNSVYLFIYLFI